MIAKPLSPHEKQEIEDCVEILRRREKVLLHTPVIDFCPENFAEYEDVLDQLRILGEKPCLLQQSA